MNLLEAEMLDLLKRGREEFGVVAVKAEFEAEGTRPDEFIRLLDLARRADLKVALKIGGCEAVSDLCASKVYGVDYIIAPMVETPYALKKFVDAKNKVYDGETPNVDFLFNVETQTTLLNFEEMLPIARAGLDGVVFGRVDFTQSRGLSRSSINDAGISEAVLKVARDCLDSGLDLVVGGGVANEAIPALGKFRAVRLDRFETRKVIFDGAMAERDSLAAGIENAVNFELAWLKNKRDYYGRISNEDVARIQMIESRIGGQPIRATCAA